MSDLRCPRCHYDLAWVPGQWTSSCPLRGTCTECGLEFEWALLHSPALAAPEWFVEHPVRQPRFGFVRTLARLVLPWRFWRQVPMDVPLDVKRLFTFVVMILVTMHVLKVAEAIDSKQFIGAQNRERDGRRGDRYKLLEIEAEAGYTYFLAARFHLEHRNEIRTGAYWEPVIWKQREVPCG